MAWSTSPAATELEQVTLDWLAQLLGLPREWHGHIEDTASTGDARRARGGARTLRPDGVVYASEHANFSVEKAARILGLEYRTVPVDDEFRMRDRLPARRRGRRRRDGRHDLVDVGRPGAGARRPLRARPASGCTSTPRTRARRPSAPSCAGASTAATAPTRSSSTRTSGCSRRSTARRSGRGGPRSCTRRSRRTPTTSPRREGALDLRDYGPALGRRFRALKLWTVLRWYGRDGLQALIREHVRLAALFEEWVRAEPGWEVVAPRHFSTVCFRRVDADNDEIARRGRPRPGELFVATTKLRGERVIRLAIGNARTQEADVARAWEVLRECAR